MSLDEQGDDEDLHFFELMRRRMAPKHQKAGSVLDRVNDVYVRSPRDNVLNNRFTKFLTYVTAKQRHGRIGKGNAFFITGESGAGKSDIVEHLLMEHPVLQPVTHRSKLIRPWIRVALQGPATLRVLGAEILSAVQYHVKSTLREAEVWRILPNQLKEARVFLIHIDETQHLMSKGADTEAVASAIKGVMNNTSWPVSFVLSGKPRLNDLILHDDQAERRSFSLPLPAVDSTNSRELIEKIIKELCEAAELNHDELLQSDMPERIAHAANHQFGRICEVVILGIHVAVLKGAKKLTRDDFARAYREHSHTTGLDEMNPFFVDDWRSLKPGYLVFGKDDAP